MDSRQKLIIALRNLYSLERLYIAYDDNEDYIDYINELFEIISKNIDNIDDLVDSLDFNKKDESIFLNYIPIIIEKLNKKEDKIKLHECIKKQKEKYPNVNFGVCLNKYIKYIN